MPKPTKPIKHDDKAAELVTKAVAAIILDDPFYGYLLLRQEIVQDTTLPTAATNGKQIRYNPEFVRKLSPGKLKGLFKHEVMHVAHLHHLRRQNRDPQKWNMAGDYVINGLLKEAKCDLPEGGLYNAAYSSFSTEHVYSLLPDPPPGGGNGAGELDENGGFKPNWDFGGVEDAPGSENEAEREQMEADAKLDVIQAANAAKVMGKLPAGIERLLDDIKQSRMPWRKLLWRWFRATAKDDDSWLRPNRRFLAHNLYLPGLHSNALGPIVIVGDTSGSVGEEEMSAFFGCVNGILKHAKPESIHMLWCDADVHEVQVFKPRDLPLTAKKFKPKGGGGTDFRPPFDYVKEHNIKPAVLLYLTDMCGMFPDKAPPYPVLWCATTSAKGPFGKTIEIK